MTNDGHADITGERKIAQPTQSSSDTRAPGLVQVPDAIEKIRREAPHEVPPTITGEDYQRQKEKEWLDSNRMRWLQDLDKIGNEAKSEHVRLQAKLRLLDEQGDKPAARQPKEDDDDIPSTIIIPEA